MGWNSWNAFENRIDDKMVREMADEIASLLIDLAFCHLPFASAGAAELACDLKAGLCPFDGELPFHLGETGHNVEKEAYRGGAGVDRIGKAFELDAPLVQFAHKVHAMLYASPKPIEFPDD